MKSRSITILILTFSLSVIPCSASVFEYGVATRGPLSLLGNIDMTGTNVVVEGDVYIESSNQDEVLSIIGNSQIAGDAFITNPDGYVTLQGGQAGIGGETGYDALNHVSVGVSLIEFPVPNPTYFEQYVQNTFDPAIHDTSADNTFENIRIPGGTNPTFSGSTTLSGIVFIESPNIVIFTSNVDITGIIVGDGDMYDNSGTNHIVFLGNISSFPVSNLPNEPQFDQLQDETVFLIAPGFSANFAGNFDILNGVIAANGINFFGNAEGIINGTTLNYSDTPMTLSGNGDLFFYSSGINYNPNSHAFLPLPIQAVVDIQPDSCPNPLNVKSKGVLSVAILGTQDFDVTTIDPASIFLDSVPSIRSGYEDVAGFIADANDCECTTLQGDGFTDLTLKFKTQDIVATFGEVNHDDILELKLDGMLYNDTPVEGIDCIVIRGKHKPINKADINKDGVVNMADVVMVAKNWLLSSIVED
jgi:hypothetical protein